MANLATALKGLTLSMLRIPLFKANDAKIFEKLLNPVIWYQLDSSHRVLSDEYPRARVIVIFRFFVKAKLGLKKLFVFCKATPIELLVLQAFLEKKFCQTPKKKKKKVDFGVLRTKVV